MIRTSFLPPAGFPTLRTFGLALLAALASAHPAVSADGTWNVAGGTSSWDTNTNWVGNIIADDIDNTADFSTLDISGTTTVELAGPRTIGNITFGDIDTSTAGSWIIANDVLTLDVTTGAPTITVNALGTNASARINSEIAGTDGLTKAGAGRLILGSANSYTGATSISEGNLTILNGGALGSGDVTVESGARLQLQGSSVANNININGTSALYINGGSNTLSGTITLESNATIANTNSNNNSVDLSGQVDLNGFTLNVANNGSGSPITISGVINGAGEINKNQGSPLTISNDQSTTFTGDVRLSNGTLLLGHDGAMGTGTFIMGRNDGGVAVRSTDAEDRTYATVFQLGGNLRSTYTFGTSTTGKQTFSDTADITFGTRIFNTNSDTTFAGGFVGGGAMTKGGNAKLILQGVNTYSGSTTVEAGGLIVDGSLSSAITVEAGFLGGSGVVSGGVIIQSGARLAPGNSAGLLTSENNVALETGSSFEFELTMDTESGRGTNYDAMDINGSGILSIFDGVAADLVFNGEGSTVDFTSSFWDSDRSWLVFDNANGSALSSGDIFDMINISLDSLGQDFAVTEGELSFGLVGNDIFLNYTAIPQPTSMALLGIALVPTVLVRRRRVT